MSATPLPAMAVMPALPMQGFCNETVDAISTRLAGPSTRGSIGAGSFRSLRAMRLP